MEKIKYLAKKLKAFTLEEIMPLAELPQEILEEKLNLLIKEKCIKLTNLGYVYIEKTTSETIRKKSVKSKKINPPRIKKYKSKIEFNIQKSTLLQQIEGMETHKISEIVARRIWNSATPFRKAKAEFYLDFLRKTMSLYGGSLQDYIKNHNSKNPEFTTSYNSILRMRKAYATYGKVGLLGIKIPYNAKYVSNFEYYELFKKLYLNKLRFSAEKCIEEVAKYYDTELINLPCLRSFRSWLSKEFTREDLKKLRSF